VLILSLFLYVKLFYYRFCHEIDNVQEALCVANLGEGGKNFRKLSYHDIITRCIIACNTQNLLEVRCFFLSFGLILTLSAIPNSCRIFANAVAKLSPE
jgi:hypothetical protein